MYFIKPPRDVQNIKHGIFGTNLAWIVKFSQTVLSNFFLHSQSSSHCTTKSLILFLDVLLVCSITIVLNIQDYLLTLQQQCSHNGMYRSHLPQGFCCRSDLPKKPWGLHVYVAAWENYPLIRKCVLDDFQIPQHLSLVQAKLTPQRKDITKEIEREIEKEFKFETIYENGNEWDWWNSKGMDKLESSRLFDFCLWPYTFLQNYSSVVSEASLFIALNIPICDRQHICCSP